MGSHLANRHSASHPRDLYSTNQMGLVRVFRPANTKSDFAVRETAVSTNHKGIDVAFDG